MVAALGVHAIQAHHAEHLLTLWHTATNCLLSHLKVFTIQPMVAVPGALVTPAHPVAIFAVLPTAEKNYLQTPAKAYIIQTMAEGVGVEEVNFL